MFKIVKLVLCFSIREDIKFYFYSQRIIEKICSETIWLLKKHNAKSVLQCKFILFTKNVRIFVRYYEISKIRIKSNKTEK